MGFLVVALYQPSVASDGQYGRTLEASLGWKYSHAESELIHSLRLVAQHSTYSTSTSSPTSLLGEIIFSALDIACPFAGHELHLAGGSAASGTENTADDDGSDIKHTESPTGNDPARVARIALARRYRAVRLRLCACVRERLSQSLSLA